MSATKEARNQAYLDGYELRPVFERYQGTDLEPYYLAGVEGRPQYRNQRPAAVEEALEAGQRYKKTMEALAAIEEPAR